MKAATEMIEMPRSSRGHPSRLFVELTTRCNLQCGMCVKQSSDNSIAPGSMSPETFEALVPAFSRLEALILNGIGESLLHPSLEVFIRKAKQSLPPNAWVGFQSNGMLLDRDRAASLVEAGLDRICLSLDTLSRDSFRSIRKGGEMGGVESAFDALNTAVRRSGRRDFRIGIEFVVMRNNLPELPSALRWAARQGASFALVTHLLPYHETQTNAVAYDTNTAGAISIYERWKAEARAEGVDLRRHNDIFMKVLKTSEDLKVLRFIEQMKNDALSRGIALHLERLLARDEGWFAKVEQVFEEARSAARQEGIELHLPGIAPQNTRKCDFVEKNGAFISWDGRVHPCYFLWHRYRCFIGGWEKKVKPRVFGDLREQDIREIWNSRDYLSFRQNVLRYDFPFCYDCGFALCDYAGDEDFEQDCYLENVPCGGCLWCTGLFQCLQ